MEVIFYKSCDEIPLYNFHRFMETETYAYLIRGWKDYYPEPKYDKEEASEIWDQIFEEYCILIEDNKTLMIFSVQSQLLYLETRYKVAGMFLLHLRDNFEVPEVVDMCIDRLKFWGYVIDKEKPISDELKKVTKHYKASINKIHLKQDELSKLKENESDQVMSLMEQIAKMEIALNKNSIDPETTVVSKWIAYNKNLEQINEAKRKAYSKR